YIYFFPNVFLYLCSGVGSAALKRARLQRVEAGADEQVDFMRSQRTAPANKNGEAPQGFQPGIGRPIAPPQPEYPVEKTAETRSFTNAARPIVFGKRDHLHFKRRECIVLNGPAGRDHFEDKRLLIESAIRHRSSP